MSHEMNALAPGAGYSSVTRARAAKRKRIMKPAADAAKNATSLELGTFTLSPTAFSVMERCMNESTPPTKTAQLGAALLRSLAAKKS